MSEQRMQSFTEFWPYYLGEHRSSSCRALHYIGTSLAILVVGLCIAFRRPGLLGFALLAGYGPAWVAHFFIEKNKPATFDYPLWSFFADFKMLAFFLAGKLSRELEQVTENSA